MNQDKAMILREENRKKGVIILDDAATKPMKSEILQHYIIPEPKLFIPCIIQEPNDRLAPNDKYRNPFTHGLTYNPYSELKITVSFKNITTRTN